MTNLSDESVNRLGWALDAAANLDVFGKDVITRLYRAAVNAQGGPLTVNAARKLKEKIRPRDPVVIATGFPERAWLARPIAETDGPPGAATLARSLHLAFGALPVILVDEPFVEMMEKTCRGAGMVTLDIQYLENIRREGGFQAAFVVGAPLDRSASRRLLDELMEQLSPAACIAIERPGRNECGIFHQVGGQRIPDDAVADMDHVFEWAANRGIFTLGVGDGGNEIGMGVIADALADILPVTRRCQCSCGGGSAAATKTDMLVTGTCSNWAATAIEGAVALVSGNRHALHTAELDRRALEACIAAGAIDGGVAYNTELAVDDIQWPAYRSIADLSRDIVDRALGRP